MTTAPISFRAAAPINTLVSQLGALAELAGTWAGTGFNLIAVPDQHKPFRLILNSTKEQLVFTPIGAPVPNRASAPGQDDIFIYGLTYLQQVSDAVTNGALHIETGMWLNVPSTNVPSDPPSIVRLSTIPHGDSLLAQGKGQTFSGPPTILPVDTTPFGIGLPPPGSGYLDPYKNTTPPAGFDIENPNASLNNAIKGQTIDSFVVLDVTSVQDPNAVPPVGGVLNIPFVTVNAGAASLQSTFWIETVQQANGGGTFLQLQYSQTVIIDFLGIHWPHVSVATLIKQ